MHPKSELDLTKIYLGTKPFSSISLKILLASSKLPFLQRPFIRVLKLSIPGIQAAKSLGLGNVKLPNPDDFLFCIFVSYYYIGTYLSFLTRQANVYTIYHI